MKILFLLLALMMVPACKCVDKGEIATWKWGDYIVSGMCPVKRFPIPVKFMLGEKAEKQALDALNRDVGYTVLVVDNKDGIPVMQATPKNTSKFHERCEAVRLLEGTDLSPSFERKLAWTEWEGKPQAWKIKVLVCLKTFKKALSLVRTPVAQRLKELGLYGVLKHEFAHLLIGPNHPRLYAELMSRKQQSTSLHHHTKTLILQTLVNPCRSGK